MGVQPLPKRHWFHILLALSAGCQHGSGIVRQVLDQTEGSLRLWPAMLYGSLDELSALGWIAEVTDPKERPPGESQKKRFYKITAEGNLVLKTEAERLQALAAVALQRATSGNLVT